MRSLANDLSTRRKYWSPSRNELELKTPELIIAVEHGRLLVAAVPHVVGKMSLARCDTAVLARLVGT